jgi:thiol:disulfide interchange protein DsbD
MSLTRLKILALFYATLSLPTEAAPPTTLTPVLFEELSSEVKKAVGVRGEIEASADEEALTAKITLYVRGRFHLYSDKTAFWILPSSGDSTWKLSGIETPKTSKFLDPITKTYMDGYTGESVFRIHLIKTKDNPSSESKNIDIGATFQACDAHVCLLPVAVKISLVPSSIQPARAESSNTKDSYWDRVNSYFQESLAFLEDGITSPTGLLVLFLAGLITAFTPCVYPIYPITLALFSRWSSQQKSSSGLLVLSYCFGMTITYAVLGTLTVASGSLFGSLTQTPFFLIGIGLLILISAVFFSGFVTFPMPSFLVSALSKPEGEATKGENHSPLQKITSISKASLMGAGIGVVAAPCVGPVLMAILVWLAAASAQGSLPYLEGFFLLSVFGVGMSLPFLVLGFLMLALKKKVQGIGRLTPIVKTFGTVLMLVSSLFFLIPGFNLLGDRANHTAAELRYPIRSFSEWTKEKYTVIDFRADWCPPCIQLENETFSHPRVAGLFENGAWEMVRVDMTVSTNETDALSKEFGIVGLPTVLLAAPGGRVCAKLKLFGFENASRFLARLKHAERDC